MKIVVDKKIKKLDGEVEDLLQTSQVVKETEDLKTIESVIDTSSDFTLSAPSLTELHIESDNPIKVQIERQTFYVVDLLNITSFSFIGQNDYLNITLSNLSATDKAKIKIVMVV